MTGGLLMSTVEKVEASALHGRSLRYFDLVMAAFVVILLLSNILGAGKVARSTCRSSGCGRSAPASCSSRSLRHRRRPDRGLRLCPRAPLHLGRDRGLAVHGVHGWVVVALPPAADWTGQAAYEQVFGQVPRIVMASIIAFWAGEFVNSVVLARMKVWTGASICGRGPSAARSPVRVWTA
jgi:hypothetical protein